MEEWICDLQVGNHLYSVIRYAYIDSAIAAVS